MEKSYLNEVRKQHSLKELEALHERFEKEYNDWKEVLTLSEEMFRASQKSFGYAKELIESAAPEILKVKPGLIKRFTTVVSESKELKNLYNLYENMYSVNENTDLARVISEWKEKTGSCTMKKLSEEMKKLEAIISEAYAICPDWECKNFPGIDRDTFYSLVEGIYLDNPKNTNNLVEYNNRIDQVKVVAAEQNKQIKMLKENKFRASRENEFNEAKNTCVASLNEAKNRFSIEGDSDSAEKVDSYISKVESKVYNLETIEEDINNFKNLSKCFL